MLLERITSHTVVAVKALPETIRGAQGFGSSGLNTLREYADISSATATIAAPFTDLMQKCKDWDWLPVQQHSFETLKSRLPQAPVLVHTDHIKPYMQRMDASDVIV